MSEAEKIVTLPEDVEDWQFLLAPVEPMVRETLYASLYVTAADLADALVIAGRMVDGFNKVLPRESAVRILAIAILDVEGAHDLDE